jgi:hypothetical protein
MKLETNKKRTLLYISIVVILAIILAPYTWKIVRSLLFEPASYNWWFFQQFSHIFPQSLYWIFLIGSLGVVSVLLIIYRLWSPRWGDQKIEREKGPIKALADLCELSEKSHYAKWIIANRVARTSQQLFARVFRNKGEISLQLSDYKDVLPENIMMYLLAGLDNSHMNPKSKRFFWSKKEQSPLDIDLDQVISFLESQLE